ncbi:MAG: lysophospholipase [Pseudomonadota bacterium]
MESLASVREHTLLAADGTALFVRDSMLPADQAATRRGIVLMHGLGEHSGRYAHVLRFFNQCGFSVRCYDHRGHGRSGGVRGGVPNGDPLVFDAQIVIEDFAKKFSTPPLLCGHSMGGLIAARFATAAISPLGGLILSSPALAIPLSQGQALLLKVLSRLAPGLTLANGVPKKYLSHAPTVATAYKTDPLVHSRINARLLRLMFKMILHAQDHAAALSIPTLIVAAGDDHLVDLNGSKAFFAKLPDGMATLHVYDGFYHEVFNEIEAARVFDDIRLWLDERGLMAPAS